MSILESMERLFCPGEVIFIGPFGEGNILQEIDGVVKSQDQCLDKDNVKPKKTSRNNSNKKKLTKTSSTNVKRQDQFLDQDVVMPRRTLPNSSSNNKMTKNISIEVQKRRHKQN
ncbi:hypothetical protein WA026_017601 [Henosepilachna vigintioctopunctata]|uniref:Uncharacterized protein n=1 Tax=Henosepilachna vigintioctopunctata TaxID=420089 RepID=A0AAW1V3K2_9CUCU